MPRRAKAKTTTTTIRLESDLRDMLEHIASREYRTLTNQMTLFLRESCESYMAIHGLRYYPDAGEILTQEEHDEFLNPF